MADESGIDHPNRLYAGMRRVLRGLAGATEAVASEGEPEPAQAPVEVVPDDLAVESAVTQSAPLPSQVIDLKNVVNYGKSTFPAFTKEMSIQVSERRLIEVVATADADLLIREFEGPEGIITSLVQDGEVPAEAAETVTNALAMLKVWRQGPNPDALIYKRLMAQLVSVLLPQLLDRDSVRSVLGRSGADEVLADEVHEYMTAALTAAVGMGDPDPARGVTEMERAASASERMALSLETIATASSKGPARGLVDAAAKGAAGQAGKVVLTWALQEFTDPWMRLRVSLVVYLPHVMSVLTTQGPF